MNGLFAEGLSFGELQRELRETTSFELVLAAPTGAALAMTPMDRLERLEEKEQEWREVVRAAGGILLFFFVLAMLSRR